MLNGGNGENNRGKSKAIIDQTVTTTPVHMPMNHELYETDVQASCNARYNSRYDLRNIGR